jgi:pyruvate dehydrogenase complex dehydrogenase (E1) component
MEIPPKVKIPICIEQGSVFNFCMAFDGPGRQSKNRYFVVVNRNPKTDTILIMVTSTTQIAKKREFIKRSGISEKTVVQVSPKEYSVFNVESVFNCNDVYEVSMQDLIRKIEESGCMNYSKIPDNTLKKIIVGINESPNVPPAIKKLL